MDDFIRFVRLIPADSSVLECAFWALILNSGSTVVGEGSSGG